MRPNQSFLCVALATLGACGGGLHQIGATNSSNQQTASENAAKKNPFLAARFFLNPEYASLVEETARRHPDEANLIRKVKAYPTAMWVDTIAKIKSVPGWLDEAKKQQAESGKPTLTVLVIYDLPNRDCAAAASAGELKVSENGEARYKSEYIDPLAAIFRAHPNQPIVLILEPDSLGNLATNMTLPTCIEAKHAYREGIAYAIRKFQLPSVSIYLDAAHAGWLGFDGNRTKIAKIFRQVLEDAGGFDTIRGFATNTSNYTHLYNRDGASLEPVDPCVNELTYVKMLGKTLDLIGVKNKGFLIDTSRNGTGGIRHKWGHWCNIKGAGLGERPVAAPVPTVDAYFWIKPPGESDGVSDPSQPRFDTECASEDSAKGAPQAGQWFESYFLDLVHNATPPL